MTEQRHLLPPDNLPDLSRFTPHSPRMALRRAFHRGGAKDHTSYVLQVNSVRLADIAIAEYSYARSAIEQYHEEKQDFRIGCIFRASGHFENCIWHLERFIKHAQALRSAQFAPDDLKVLIPRTLSFLQSSVIRRVMQMRHSLAHLEGDALKGHLPQGSNIALLALITGLEVGSHRIAWDELVAWLRDIHSCASALADYIPSDAKKTHA